MPEKAKASGLRAVAEGERAEVARKPVLTITEAAEAGDRLAELKAMRLIIARALPGAPARDMAALSRRQIEIGREIEAIETAEDGDEIGDAAETPDEKWDASSI